MRRTVIYGTASPFFKKITRQDYKAETSTLNMKKSILSANSLMTASCDHSHDHDCYYVFDHCLTKEMSTQEEIDFSQIK